MTRVPASTSASALRALTSADAARRASQRRRDRSTLAILAWIAQGLHELHAQGPGPFHFGSPGQTDAVVSHREAHVGAVAAHLHDAQTVSIAPASAHGSPLGGCLETRG